MARARTIDVKVNGAGKFAALAAFVVVLNAAFWLGLLAGALLLVRAIFL